MMRVRAIWSTSATSSLVRKGSAWNASSPAFFGEHTVQSECVEMGIQSEVRADALHRGDGAALAALDAAVAHLVAIPAQHGVHERAAHGSKQLGVVREPRAQLERQRQDELPERGVIWQNVIHEVGGARRHAPAQASRAKGAPLARKRHGLLLPAIAASEYRKSSRQDPAIDIALELGAYEAGQRRGEAVLRGFVERAQVFAHDPVQGARLRPAPRIRRLDGHDARKRNPRADRAREGFPLHGGGAWVAASFPPAAAATRRAKPMAGPEQRG
ncbi:MAG: hypothetical protein IPI67_37135 [Myxococcales bacterium]|nr:hypothetical protein [Myxococcales bacterium]